MYDLRVPTPRVCNVQHIPQSSSLGGVVVSVLATGPKTLQVRTRTRRWIIKDDKNPQHAFLRMVSKAGVPMS
jgi:hypothetical protein